MDNRSKARSARNVTKEVSRGCNRLEAVNGPDVLGDAPARTVFGTASDGLAASKTRLPPALISVDPVQSRGLFEAKSGLDITQKVIELLWLASERDHPTFEEIQKNCADDKLAPDDIAAICQILGQAGVALIEASAVRPAQPTIRPAANELGQRKLHSAAVQDYLRRIGEGQRLEPVVDADPLTRIKAADHEMRQIIYGFGFAAHQHVVWAEKLLASPSAKRLEHVLAGLEIRSRNQYVKALPHLVKQVRALDHKAAAAYREWRQEPDQPDGGKHLTEFRRLNHELQQMLPQFCYQVTIIQQMMAIAENIALQFRNSQRVQEQVRQGHNSAVCQLPLADVERQAVETMEEFVRMPCEEFLRNCARLKAAAAEFQQARCQLIHDHLPLVASIAGSHRNDSLPQPRLIREGIFGLLRAVEKYGYKYSWRFSANASWWIRQSMREALAAQPRKEENAAEMVVAG